MQKNWKSKTQTSKNENGNTLETHYEVGVKAQLRLPDCLFGYFLTAFPCQGEENVIHSLGRAALPISVCKGCYCYHDHFLNTFEIPLHSRPTAAKTMKVPIVLKFSLNYIVFESKKEKNNIQGVTTPVKSDLCRNWWTTVTIKQMLRAV